MLFEPFKLKTIELKNRILRSSMGGKTSYYGGAVSQAFQHFDTRFAERGVAAIISSTISVDNRRWASLQYPKISEDRFIGPIKVGVGKVFSCSLLAPDIIESILEGRQPHDLNFEKLCEQVPSSWAEQRERFGFPTVSSHEESIPAIGP
jgi:hypothetical protein